MLHRLMVLREPHWNPLNPETTVSHANSSQFLLFMFNVSTEHLGHCTPGPCCLKDGYHDPWDNSLFGG